MDRIKSKVFIVDFQPKKLLVTATLNEFFMLRRVRKKVSIQLKAPKAPLFEYVN